MVFWRRIEYLRHNDLDIYKIMLHLMAPYHGWNSLVMPYEILIPGKPVGAYVKVEYLYILVYFVVYLELERLNRRDERNESEHK